MEKALSRAILNPSSFLTGNFKVKFVPDTPPRLDGGPSWAVTRLSVRRILMWEEIGKYPVQQAFLHETGHVIDGDHLTATFAMQTCPSCSGS